MVPNDGDLDAVERPIPVDRLLSAIRDGSTDDLDVRGTDEDDVREELAQVHLPMLEEAGYVEWDRESGEIRKGPNFEEIKPVLEKLREELRE